MKPLFISRDGVINQRLAGGVTHRTQLELIAGSVDTIARLSQQGFSIVMVTHQPGLSRGVFDLDELEAIHSKIIEAVENRGGHISATFYCPHDEQDHCNCRPPATGLIDVIEMELDCHAQDAFYFCDNPEEADVAKRKGCHTILCDEQQPLQDAVKHIH